MAATALLKLSRLTGEDRWQDAALDCLTLMSSQWSREPLTSGQALLSLDDWLGSDSTPAQLPARPRPGPRACPSR